MTNLPRIFRLFLLLTTLPCTSQENPQPVGPIPSERQLAWHELEYYGFLHFNMNTFTDMEWGSGGESPETFNPTALDARQWARVARDAGMKGLIITAKHHDGFCLWPTQTTEHSVKNSPWKNGKGDVIRELAEACKEYGLKMGVYLSPWDRNHPEYAREEYVKVFHKQLEELLTSYGDIFEVWFDGANGGTGYYGGANENRKIDHRSYYQWDKVEALIRKHQPEAVIFGDNGPDVRWVGNEHGFAGETNWSMIRKAEVYSGSGRHKELQFGHEDGTHWIPAEADVSIRPGWYYHKKEDHLVKALPQLLDIYYHSVGRNASLLLNLPVDQRGLIHEKDVEQLMKLRRKLDEDFDTNLASEEVRVEADSFWGNSSKYEAANTIDGDNRTYWAAEKGATSAQLTLTFEEPAAFNRFLIQEYIPLGQRVRKFSLEALVNGKWEEITSQTTIGYKRILRFDPVTTTELRLNISDSKATPLISNIEVYNAPLLLMAPEVARNREGQILIEVPDDNAEVYYSLNGTLPDIASGREYINPLQHPQPVRVKAVAYDPVTGEYSETTTVDLDIPKTEWKLVEVGSGNFEEASKIIDTDIFSWWSSDKDQDLPQEVVVDLGREYDLSGFTYYPPQDRWSFGIISHYKFEISSDGKNWEKMASGEFGNIRNNPIEQTIPFEPYRGRFIKFTGTGTTDASGAISIGELGVITEQGPKTGN